MIYCRDAVYIALYNVINLANYPVYRVMMNFTQYLNHSINGVLYCIVGSRFRMQIKKVLCRKERPDDNSASYSVSLPSVKQGSNINL